MEFFITDYYVLEKETEKTIAVFKDADAARWFVANYKTSCIIRIVITRK